MLGLFFAYFFTIVPLFPMMKSPYSVEIVFLSDKVQFCDTFGESFIRAFSQ
jgi:hypothetical protein